MIEFTPWPKIARLNREITITEKIDGTNAAVGIVDMSNPDPCGEISDDAKYLRTDAGIGWPFAVYAQSRTRLMTPKADNFGFAQWVWANAEELVTTLGPGLHFGEWWGSGIQRGYGLPKGEKRFSLFNTGRWCDDPALHAIPGLGVVPVLYQGPFDRNTRSDYGNAHYPDELLLMPWVNTLDDLRSHGSFASPGFMNPEGIVIYHKPANQMFKVTLEGDEEPKSVAYASKAA